MMKDERKRWAGQWQSSFQSRTRSLGRERRSSSRGGSRSQRLVSFMHVSRVPSPSSPPSLDLPRCVSRQQQADGLACQLRFDSKEEAHRCRRRSRLAVSPMHWSLPPPSSLLRLWSRQHQRRLSPIWLSAAPPDRVRLWPQRLARVGSNRGSSTGAHSP